MAFYPGAFLGGGVETPFASYTTPGKITRAEWLKLLWSRSWPDARDDGQASGRFSFDIDGNFDINYFWGNITAYVLSPGRKLFLPSFTDMSASYNDGDYSAPLSEIFGVNDNAYLSAYLDRDVVTILNHATSTHSLQIFANWVTLNNSNVKLISSDGGTEIDMVTTGVSIPPESSISIRWDHARQQLQEI
ncbi:hypothetical protein ACMV5I_23700 [Serratia sp. T13T92]|uniref:hypothetical protein n=1 Tax=Serratia sp. T13T92 TaxID=3397496 RepID=UPI0039DF3778